MMSEHPELPDLIRKTGVPVPQVLDRSGETLAWKPAEDMAPKLDAISTAVAARATEATLAQIKTALTDGSLKAQLSGSLLQLSKVTSDSASIVAVGTQEHISFVASGTNLARLVDIGLYVPAVSGATSGTHTLYVALGISGGSYDRLWQRSVAYNVSISCNTNSLLPDSNTALGAILGGIVFSADLPIRITYDNQTNAAQEGQRRYRIVKLEGGVPW